MLSGCRGVLVNGDVVLEDSGQNGALLAMRIGFMIPFVGAERCAHARISGGGRGEDSYPGSALRRQLALTTSNGGGPRSSIPPFSFADAWTRAMSTRLEVSSVAGSLAPR